MRVPDHAPKVTLFWIVTPTEVYGTTPIPRAPTSEPATIRKKTQNAADIATA